VNCQGKIRSPLLYLFIRSVIAKITVIIGQIALSTAYKILSNILLSRVTLYAEEIIGDH